MGKWLPGLSLLTLMTVASGQGAIASELEGVGERETETTTTVTEWIAQSEASLVQITNVRLETTEAGLQMVLETANGELATPTTTISGDALIAEIPNAVLALAEGDEFQQFEPVDGIALVQVTELPGERVQVVITGTDAAPTAEFSTAATGLTLGIAPGIAQAGTADDTLRVVVTGEEEGYFEPTATTGTRTDTPLRDIPQSIQVIPQEVIEDQQVTDLDDVLRNASGVVPSRSNDGTGQRFIVRGFEGASVLRDGFRLSFGAVGATGFQELANLEQVEVLKGPAAILFGVVEPGGVINLVTKQPLGEPFYNFSVRAGNRGLLEPSLDLSGPLTRDGRVRYRLNALYRTEEYFRDFNTDVRRSFISPVISWQISDRTDLTVSLEYLEDERPAEFGLVAIEDEVADIPFDRVLGDPDDIINTETLRIGYNFEHRFSDNLTLRNAFSYWRNEDESILTSSFLSFLPFNEVTGNLPRNVAFSGGVPQDSFELQTNLIGKFNTGPVEHTVLAGIDLYRRNGAAFLRSDPFLSFPINIFDPVYDPIPVNPRDLPISFDQETQVDALGIYIQDQVTLLDNLKLLLGVRYETVEQENINNPSAFVPVGTESTQNDDAFSPRFGIVYQPIDEVSLFASYSRSFVPNSATTFSGDLLDPERGEQFEVGAKVELLEGRLAVNLAYFDITKENVATPDPDFPIFFVATGEERSQGVELDIVGEILPGWNLIANYAYTDARITSANNALEDNRLFSVPKHNLNLWTTYDIQQGSLEGLGFGLGFNYVSERFGDNANSFELDSYFLTNAAISYQRDNWQFGLNFRNLFDVDYITNTTNSRNFRIEPGEGFTVIGSLSFEF